MSCKVYATIETTKKGLGVIVIFRSRGENYDKLIIERPTVKHKVEAAMFVYRANFGIAVIAEPCWSMTSCEVTCKKIFERKLNWDKWASNCIDSYLDYLPFYFLHAYDLKLEKKEQKIIKKELKKHYEQTKDFKIEEKQTNDLPENLTMTSKDFRKCRVENFKQMRSKWIDSQKEQNHEEEPN